MSNTQNDEIKENAYELGWEKGYSYGLNEILAELNEIAKKDASDYTSETNKERQHLIEFIMAKLKE